MSSLLAVLFAASLHSNALGVLALMLIFVAIAALWSILGHILGDNPRGAIGIIVLIGLAAMVATNDGRATLAGGVTKAWNTFFG
jgi:hypothetical protein